MTDPTSPTDFEAAAAVAAALKDLPKPRQELVLRWVAGESGDRRASGVASVTSAHAADCRSPPCGSPHADASSDCSTPGGYRIIRC